MAGHQELNRNTSGNNEPQVPADKSLPEAPHSQASQPQSSQDKDKQLDCDKMDKTDADIDHGCEQVANKTSARPDEKHHVEHDDRAISTAISDQKEEHQDDDIAIEEGENTCRSPESDAD